MQRLICKGWTIAAVMVGLLVLAAAGRAAETQPSSEAAWAPKLFGFCMEIHDAKKRSIPEQAQMLRELGFDGVGYPLWLDENLEKNLRTLDEAGLGVYLLYARISLKPDTPPYDPRVPHAIRKLKGRMPLVHLKDMVMRGHEQLMAEVGEGNLNWPAILDACREAGVVWYIVEQDTCQRDPFESLAISLSNLKAMGLP